MVLSPSEEHLVYYLSLSASCLSFLGSLFIILVYFSVARFRSEPSFRLVLYLSLSDLSFSTAWFLGPDATGFRCELQAVLLSYFGLSTVLWTVMIAGDSYMQIRSARKGSRTGCFSERTKLLVCFGVPLLFAALPFSTDSYGRRIAWCWFKLNNGQKAGNVAWQLALFYVPLWAAFIFNFLCSLGFQREYTAMVSELTGLDEAVKRAQMRNAKHMQWYPWVMFACWAVGTVDQVLIYAIPRLETGQLWMGAMHFGFGSLQGIGNAIVYGLNREVWTELSDRARRVWRCREQVEKPLQDYARM